MGSLPFVEFSRIVYQGAAGRYLRLALTVAVLVKHQEHTDDAGMDDADRRIDITELHPNLAPRADGEVEIDDRLADLISVAGTNSGASR